MIYYVYQYPKVLNLKLKKNTEIYYRHAGSGTDLEDFRGTTEIINYYRMYLILN